MSAWQKRGAGAIKVQNALDPRPPAARPKQLFMVSSGVVSTVQEGFGFGGVRAFRGRCVARVAQFDNLQHHPPPSRKTTNVEVSAPLW